MFLLYGNDNVHNFQHFMDENISLLGYYFSNNLDCEIKVPETHYNSTLKDVLDIFGLRATVIRGPVIPVLSEPMWTVTKNKVLFYTKLKDNLPNFESGPEKIYLKRTWGPGSGGHSTPVRCIVNEDEVQMYLEKNGFVTVIFDGLSFAEKKKLLQNAKEVFTQTGANCINLFLCEKLEKLTLFTNDTFIMGSYFVELWSNVYKKGLFFRELCFESLNRHLLTEPRGMPNGEDNGNFYVPVTTLLV
jgi:hypothetical protein